MTHRTGFGIATGRAPTVRRRHLGRRDTALSDEQLLDRVRGGDGHAADELLLRYRGFARSLARRYFLTGGDHDDLTQEAMIGLCKAIRDFRPGAAASFRTFAEVCIRRQVLTAVRGDTRYKHVALNSSVSLDRVGSGDLDAADVLPAEGGDPLHVLLAADEARRLRAAWCSSLSSLEAEVLQRYLDGHTYEEIAAEVGRHVKAVDNALQRAKRKLEPGLAA